MRNKLLPGMILVEMVLAFAVASIALVAIVQVTTKGLSATNFASGKSEATEYATQGMEKIIERRQALTWATFSSRAGAGPGGSTYCINDLTSLDLASWSGFASACTTPIPGTDYRRDLTLISGTPLTARITVSWNESGLNHSSVQTTYFYQY